MDAIQLVSILTALGSLITSLLFLRRTRKAEVRAKEAEAKAKEIENERGNIGTAEAMIELVKKANAEALEFQQKMIYSLKKENEKFKKNVDRLERAFKSIFHCEHRDNCPVYAELQDGKGVDDNHADGNENGNGNPP